MTSRSSRVPRRFLAILTFIVLIDAVLSAPTRPDTAHSLGIETFANNADMRPTQWRVAAACAAPRSASPQVPPHQQLRHSGGWCAVRTGVPPCAAVL